MNLSKRAGMVSGSKTSKTRNVAEAYRAQGIDVVNFAAGELDLGPPRDVIEALHAAADADTNRYTDTGGLPALREALAMRISRLSGVPRTVSEVIVTTGAKHGLYLACLVLLDPGDEVLIPSPGWGTFAAQVRIAGATAVPVPTLNSGFVPDPDLLESLRTPRTRMVILNTPHNPTGVVYPAEIVARIAEWATRNRVWIVFDDSYGELVQSDATHVHPAALVPEARDLTVTVGSFSKSFAVTGWRVGHAHGPATVIKAMANLQSHTTSNATSVVQHALLPAARGEQDAFPAHVREVLDARRETVGREIATIDHTAVHVAPQGAFYYFLDFRDAIGRELKGQRVADTDTLAALLMEHGQVALTPGSAFGVDGFMRLSFAISEESIAKGLKSMREVMQVVE